MPWKTHLFVEGHVPQLLLFINRMKSHTYNWHMRKICSCTNNRQQSEVNANNVHKTGMSKFSLRITEHKNFWWAYHKNDVWICIQERKQIQIGQICPVLGQQSSDKRRIFHYVNQI